MLKAILIPALLIILSASLCSTGYAQRGEGYWNQYRGPNGDGKTLAKGLPVEFGETKHVRWKTAIPGIGFSSPVLWDDQIWLTTAPPEGNEVYAVGVDLHSGNIVHNIKVFDIVPRDFINPFDENSDASPTPVVEQGRVYVHFGTNGTACLDTKTGAKLWERRDFECDHDIRPGSSPIIDGDSLTVAFDGRDVQYIVALDKHTGNTLWRRDREIVFENEDVPYNKAFSTAKIIEHQGRRQLISIAATAAISYVPEIGEELWRVRHRGTNSSCRPLSHTVWSISSRGKRSAA
jgi:outer membrane protein assembly factor BamB